MEGAFRPSPNEARVNVLSICPGTPHVLRKTGVICVLHRNICLFLQLAWNAKKFLCCWEYERLRLVTGPIFSCWLLQCLFAVFLIFCCVTCRAGISYIYRQIYLTLLQCSCKIVAAFAGLFAMFATGGLHIQGCVVIVGRI